MENQLHCLRSAKLNYLSANESFLVLKEAHEGKTEHVEARSLVQKVIRAEYYQPTLKFDVV